MYHLFEITQHGNSDFGINYIYENVIKCKNLKLASSAISLVNFKEMGFKISDRYLDVNV